MRSGDITIDGARVGDIDVMLMEEAPELETYAPRGPSDMPAGPDLSASARLGHKRGFYPGAERHSVRLGHKKGFHTKDNHIGGDGGGAPSAILDKAREVALHGGPGAVSRFMAEQGYPRDGNWCGEFAASVVRGAGGTPPRGAPVASNWRNWGEATSAPVPGDIAVRRGTPTGQTGSHVTIVEGYDPKTGRFIGLGGNQGAWERNLPASQYEFRHGATSRPPAPGSVRGSYFDDKNTATGLSAAAVPGIALPSREGLGKLYDVTGPNGKTVTLPQIDIGPAAWTGRGVDISRPAIKHFGYSAGSFPTDSHFTVKPHEDQPTQDEPM